MRLEERQDRLEGGTDTVLGADEEVCVERTEQSRQALLHSCPLCARPRG